MSHKKITELPLSPELRHFLLAAQKRGVDEMGGVAHLTDAMAVTLIGLCAILNEFDNISEAVAKMPEAK